MPISVIDDATNNDILFNPSIGGVKMSHGYDQEQMERDLKANPRRSMQHLFGDAPSEIKVYQESEWDALYDEQEAQQSSLQHIRMRGDHGKMIDALDQNGQGFCWNYSCTGGIMMSRAASFMPHVRLSGHANACLIKNFRDEGGWGALGLDYAIKNGSPSVQFWKEKSMSQSNNTPEMRANALLHRVTEDWSDQSVSPYDRNLTREQLATLLFNNIPVIVDFNWWSHSVLAIRWVRISKGVWGLLILNSWTNGWENNGMSILTGSKMRPDGAVAIRATVASAA